ncbi:hypothetical protein [Streptomyces sp. C]|uniref:hypothetical protein n=1 Tax=Streptomyces sp. C TaxID=253839 RepID=UPI0001DEEDCA|nr:hypothetical protein [Streptomyces sp. C]EFL13285.1 predicted protein [Streptomyces sp. C]
MTRRTLEAEPDTARRTPAETAGRRCTGRRGSALWECLGMAVAAGGLCLAVVRPELLEAAVHTVAAAGAGLAH